ncbi:hypothetical protein C5167_015618 [Papaver somniferum]|uniref:CCHC-type domain-containing protein n=1 Tax=Papaver somniferum TaxID=3469 RepID=A0A4Y7J6J7_PAPSO|nr:hypothetical protein C5167_015618 [Papaver somniferum]
MQHYGGGTYKRKRFTEEEFPREATSPSYASYLETLMRDSAPPPAVGTCPQPRRKGFDEEPALARDSSQHDKPYVDKLQDSYHGTDSCYDHGYDGTERLSGCNRADFPPDDSDYDRGGKRDDSWKRCDSRERDKKSLSRERDQSDYDRGDKRDDSWKRRDSRERDKKSLSRERDQPDYDRGGKRDDSWKRSRERDQSDYDRGGKRDDSWKRSRERDQSDYDRGGKRDDSWKRHDSRKRDKKSLSRERYRSDYDRGGKKDDSWKRSDSRERDKKSLSRERYQSDYDRGGKRDDSWKRRDSRQRDKKSLSRERDQSPRRRCRHSCSRGNDDRQRSKSPRGYSHHRSYLEDSYDVGRHSSTGKLMNRDDGRIQDHSKVVPSVTVVVKGLPEKTTKEDLYRILEAWGPFCRLRVTARKMVDGIGDAGLVVDGRSLLFQFSHRKMCLQQTAVVADVDKEKESQSKHEKENRRKKRIKKAIERAVQHEQDGEGGEKIHQNQKNLPQQQKQAPQQLLEVDGIQPEPSSHGISSSILEKRITCFKELQQQQKQPQLKLLEVDEVQHYPSSHEISSSIRLERMTCIKEDQYPKAIKEANEIGGPAVVMRFLNDPKVLQKLGDGMGFGTSGDVVNPTEYGLYSVPYDNAEDKSSKEGTSIVHRTSGVGDTEKEMDRLPKEERVTEERKMSKNQWSNRRKKLKKAHERRTALAAQFPIVEELEIGNLQHDFSADPISTSISEEGLEELMSCDKKDPYLKPIVEDIEIGVGTWPQPRRKGFDEESALARDSRQHDKPYGDSFRELDRLQEPKKYCEIDNFQVVDKYPDSYRGIDSYYNHGHDGPGMLSRCNHFPPDDFDHMPCISLTTEVSHEQSCYDSRECDKKSSSQERDQSPERTEKAIERDVQHQQDGGGERIQQIQQKLQQQQKQLQQQLLEVDEIQPEPSSILEERITCIKELQKLQQQKKQLPQQLLEVDEIQHEPSSDGISSSILEERTTCIKELRKLQLQQKQQKLLEVNEIQLEPSSHGISSSILEKRTTCSKEDQYPKAITEANEISGPAAVMRFSNDPEVLQKLGDGIGFGVSSDVVKPTEYNSPDDNAEDKSAKEDTSTSSHGISSSILEERITCIKENQYPKAITEANEIGGPAVVMRFSNDPEVLQKLGDGMNFGVSSDVVNPTEYNAPDDNAEDKSVKEDTSVHQTGGVGDIEEMDRLPKEERIREKRKMNQSRSSYRKKIKRSVRRAALAAQSREDNAPHCDTGHERKKCVTATSENSAALPIVEELEIGNLQHDFSSDPISASMLEENVEELTSCIKEDPYLKPIVEDIEIGGPTKEMDRLLKERLTEIRKMPNKQRSSKRKKFKRLYERAAQSRANNALYTGHGREECVGAVTSGNIVAIPNVEELEIGNIQHDLSSDPISTSISEEDLEELMFCIKKDPYLKPIVEDIEIGGPTIMMRYLNDPEVLQKLGQAMGFGLSGEIVDTTEPNAPADYADDKSTKENDSIVYAGHKGNCGHKDVGNEGVVVPIWNEAIAAEQINFYGFCYNCRERGHKASQCPKEKVQAGDKREQPSTGVGISNVQPRGEVVAPAWNEAIAAEPNFNRFCYNCRERGHKASQCPKEKVQRGDEREQPNTGVGNSNVEPHGQVVAPASNGAIAAKPTKFNRFCYNCRERGHKASQCPKEKVQAGNKLVQPDTGGRKQ